MRQQGIFTFLPPREPPPTKAGNGKGTGGGNPRGGRAGAKEAIERLYKKGLLTQADGGYLTDLGRNCAEHLQSALRILSS